MSAATACAPQRKRDLDALIRHYAPLVKRIACHLSGRLPASIQPADLMQAGMIGLFEAARNYDADHGASFETYAGIRIRGAMLDEVRKSDWAPRSIHRRARELAQAIAKVENVKGRAAKDHEIAEALGTTVSEYHETLQDVSGHRLLSLEDATFNDEAIATSAFDGDSDPVEALQAHQTQRILAQAIADLPERERLVLSLYYREELNLREIGDVLDVTESRVCQIHSQALIRLEARLGGRRDS